MAFIETPRFPDYFGYLAVGGPEHSTDVVELASGHEQRNINWDQARGRYEIPMPLVGSRKDELLAWRRAMRGQGHGFRLKDWADFAVTRSLGRHAEIIAGVAALSASDNGTGMPTYQLVKTYTVGTQAEHRQIRKPVSGTAKVYRAGALATAGAGAGQYALDTTTGVVSWVANQSSTVTAVTVGATTQVTLTATIGLSIGGRLYLSGLGGTVGAVLNNLAHAITNIVSNTYTISTVTTGLAWTSGGSGYRYPQPTEALDWEGQFDVPVRFADDFAGLQIEGPDVYRGNAVSLVEIRV